ncbi:MAG TPA: hypothetical protein VNR60_04140 [Croceibacterium sp.]|nr:hypothetical protein [Croceibacterium sp.]
MPPLLSGTALPDTVPDEPGMAVLRWHALAEAGRVVAELAGDHAGPEGEEPHDFAGLLDRAGGWRREHAERGIDDLIAVMEPGIAALLSINENGADPRPAARALWREFVAARGALLTLLKPTG